ncbi:MAG: hypothetical protein JHC34_06840 [Acidobacteria bacterium]|jgi:hypothetical protein|nr:hypothetical protein [Acidobacteriota bacterium]
MLKILMLAILGMLAIPLVAQASPNEPQWPCYGDDTGTRQNGMIAGWFSDDTGSVEYPLEVVLAKAGDDGKLWEIMKTTTFDRGNFAFMNVPAGGDYILIYKIGGVEVGRDHHIIVAACKVTNVTHNMSHDPS